MHSTIRGVLALGMATAAVLAVSGVLSAQSASVYHSADVSQDFSVSLCLCVSKK